MLPRTMEVLNPLPSRLGGTAVLKTSLPTFMKFSKDVAGKWVITKGQKVVDSSKSLNALVKRAKKRSDQSEVRFSLVPKGCITGAYHGA